MYRQIHTHTKNGKDKPKMNSKWNFWWCCTNGGTTVLFASSCLFCVCVCDFVAVFAIFMCFWFSFNFCCNFWVYWFFYVSWFVWVFVANLMSVNFCLSFCCNFYVCWLLSQFFLQFVNVLISFNSCNFCGCWFVVGFWNFLLCFGASVCLLDEKYCQVLQLFGGFDSLPAKRGLYVELIIMPMVAALSVSHRASAVQKKFKGSSVICLFAVVEDPFDIFFFFFLFPNEWPVDFPRSR